MDLTVREKRLTVIGRFYCISLLLRFLFKVIFFVLLLTLNAYQLLTISKYRQDNPQ